MDITGRMALKMLARGIRNKLAKRPISVSFEITHYCTANCWHCNWGGPVKGETRLSAEDYAEICRELHPVVSHISGGEPLARSDVYDIIRAQANPGGLPWIILVTNAAALKPDKYWKLKEAGCNQISISLDFPDERHNEHRRIPKLFERMDRVIPELTALGNNDISLNTCITAWNYKDLPEMVNVAERWGAPLNFSAYTPLRTSDTRGIPEDQLHRELRESIQTVIDMKKAGKPVYTAERIMWRFYEFLTQGRVEGVQCQAGERFLVINPDGTLVPCAMVWAEFEDQRDMLREFTASNTCEMCYISTRANCEKTLTDYIVDNWELLSRRVLPWRKTISEQTGPAAGNGGKPEAAERETRQSVAAQ